MEPLKTGELLAKEGYISPENIQEALLIQEKGKIGPTLKEPPLLGMILCDLNLITSWDNYYVLHKYNKLQSIQSALESRKILDRDVVERAQLNSRQQNIPFITHIIHTGLVSTEKMQALLFDLFHIPFKSINDFVYNKGAVALLTQVLDKQKSWTNKSIPLVFKNNTILFGITDPENILFMRELNDQFPQYRFKTVFISFLQFSKLYGLLYESNAGQPRPQAIKKPLDLSLLLNFKTSITDPETQKPAIKALYDRYELLRQLIGNHKRADLETEFFEYIVQTHKKITQKYNTQIIKFYLKKENRDVIIIALPET